jgi:hypothetical protein
MITRCYLTDSPRMPQNSPSSELVLLLSARLESCRLYHHHPTLYVTLPFWLLYLSIPFRLRCACSVTELLLNFSSFLLSYFYHDNAPSLLDGHPWRLFSPLLTCPISSCRSISSLRSYMLRYLTYNRHTRHFPPRRRGYKGKEGRGEVVGGRPGPCCTYEPRSFI